MPDPLAVLLPYQRDWVMDRSDVKVWEKSRQLGASWCEAADVSLIAAGESLRPDQHVWYVGYTKDMAIEFIETCATWARRFNKVFGAIESIEIDDEEDEQGIIRKIQAYQIRFGSGHKIVALSSRPSNFRGKHGIAVIDEAAFHQSIDELLKAALAFLIWGGKVRIISTHNGIENPFNKLCEECRTKKLDYALHKTTFDEALAQGLYRKICEAQGRTWSAQAEAAWAASIYARYGDGADEELRCIPRTKGGAWLPYELILAAEDPDAGKPELYAGGAIFLGNDIGRRKDLWIAWALELVGDVLVTREIRELKGASFAVQDATMDEMDLFYRARAKTVSAPQWAMDQTGMGEKPVEDAKRRYVGRVEGVIFTQQVRLDMANILKQAFEDRKIRIPAKRSEIRSDLHKPRAEKTATGGTRIVVERDEEGHADRFWSAALATAKANPFGKLPKAEIFFNGEDEGEEAAA